MVRNEPDEPSHYPEDPSQPAAALREIARGCWAANCLAQAARITIGREASETLLEIVLIPLRRAAMQQMNDLRTALLECEPHNQDGKGEHDELTNTTDTDCF